MEDLIDEQDGRSSDMGLVAFIQGQRHLHQLGYFADLHTFFVIPE